MVTGPQIGIWIYALDRGVSTRLTTDGSSQYATWSADGQELIYRGTRAGSRDLFRKRAAGTDPEQRLTTDDWSETPWSVSADGSQAAFVRQGAAGKGSDIWMLSLAAGHQARPLVQDGFNNAKPRFSRAGQWLAYVSDQSGRPEIYVQAAAAQGTRWQISSGGGTDPVWSGDGRELFYRQGQRIMSVQMAGSTEFRAGPPRALFEGDYTFTELTTDFDVQPDGQHFVMLRGARPDPPVTHIALLVNWLTELDNRLAKAR
jgi:Tol biopolymer transport system component